MTATRTALILAASLGLAAGARRAQAANDAASGVDLGVRIGYGPAMGKIAGNDGDDSLGDFFSGHLPLIVEAGYRVTPPLTLGVFFQYAFAQGPSTCGDFGIDCSGSVKRLGVQGIYRLLMPGVFVPWFGAGLGYEWMTASVGTLDVAFHGFEFLNLQLGGEFRVSPQVGLGPYLGLSVARYDGGSTSLGGGTDVDIDDKAFHEWIQIGIRARFGL